MWQNTDFARVKVNLTSPLDKQLKHISYLQPTLGTIYRLPRKKDTFRR